MKFKTVNDLNTIKIREATLAGLTLTDTRLTMSVEGAVIKGNNPNNTRYEDMYCMLMELTLDHIRLRDFCRQGYKYYNADGVIQSEVPDRSLTEQERRQVLAEVEGAYLFYFDKNPETDDYLLIFDIEKDEEVITYQLELTFEESIAQWDRYACPVNE